MVCFLSCRCCRKSVKANRKIIYECHSADFPEYTIFSRVYVGCAIREIMLKNVKRTKQNNENYSCSKVPAQVAWKRWQRTLIPKSFGVFLFLKSFCNGYSIVSLRNPFHLSFEVESLSPNISSQIYLNSASNYIRYQYWLLLFIIEFSGTNLH